MVKNCSSCVHDGCGPDEATCIYCRGTSIIGSEEYDEKPHLWAEDKNESVNHPSHYNQGKYECIEVMIEVFGIEAVKHFCLLNAFKYNWRTGEKNGNEDIEKGIWYLNKYLELATREASE